MTDPCFDSADLDELLSLPADDPRLDHLENCAACRSLLASYRKYLDPGTLPPEARQVEAQRSMQRFIEEQIIGVDTPTPTRPSYLSRLMASLRGPALAPMLVVVFALVVVTGIWATRDALRPERRTGIVRDLPVSGEETGMMPVAQVMDGGSRLSWQAIPGADAYRVQILSADLVMEREIDAGNRLSLATEAADPGEPRFARVIAARRGDEIARSPLIAMP